MQNLYKFVAIISVLVFSFQAKALEEVTADSRIRTYIYGKNDVFKVNSIYGFQTVVEFDPNDKILTISVGNPNIFKIIPSQNRLFIKALQNSQVTNMTVITAARTYQFELTSNADAPEEVMYVVRFLYPETMNIAGAAQPGTPMDINTHLPIGGMPVQNNNLTNTMPVAPMVVPSMNVSDVPSTSQILSNEGVNPNSPISMQRGGMLNLPQVHVNSSNGM